jgi:hypothetical protein
MILIDENTIEFNNDEKIVLENVIKNFTLHEEIKEYKSGKSRNYYVRQMIVEESKIINEDFISIIDKIEKYVEKIKFYKDSTIKLNKCWLNKIDTNTNKNDEFHYDSSDLSFILYLNDNFNGGVYEYINDTKEILEVKPKKFMTITTQKNQILHRVLPVLDGVRYSLVCFFDYEIKKEKLFI